jgi:hypothetical protein
MKLDNHTYRQPIDQLCVIRLIKTYVSLNKIALILRVKPPVIRVRYQTYHCYQILEYFF